MNHYEIKKDNLIIRLGYFIASLFGAALGLSFTFKGNIGVDPLNVLVGGLFVKIGFSLGFWITMLWLFFAIIAFLLGFKPYIATVIDLLFFGIILDFMVYINRVPNPTSMIGSIVYVVIGMVLLSFSVGIYINAKLGAGPNMLFTFAVADKIGFSIGVGKTIGDLIMLAIGFLLGGTVGIGTIILALGIGYLFQFFITKVSLPGLPE